MGSFRADATSLLIGRCSTFNWCGFIIALRLCLLNSDCLLFVNAVLFLGDRWSKPKLFPPFIEASLWCFFNVSELVCKCNFLTVWRASSNFSLCFCYFWWWLLLCSSSIICKDYYLMRLLCCGLVIVFNIKLVRLDSGLKSSFDKFI